MRRIAEVLRTRGAVGAGGAAGGAGGRRPSLGSGGWWRLTSGPGGVNCGGRLRGRLMGFGGMTSSSRSVRPGVSDTPAAGSAADAAAVASARADGAAAPVAGADDDAAAATAAAPAARAAARTAASIAPAGWDRWAKQTRRPPRHAPAHMAGGRRRRLLCERCRWVGPQPSDFRRTRAALGGWLSMNFSPAAATPARRHTV
jgi:hypothetical protein